MSGIAKPVSEAVQSFSKKGKTREDVELQGGPLSRKVDKYLGKILDDHSIDWEYSQNGGVTAFGEVVDRKGNVTIEKKWFRPGTTLKTVRDWLGYSVAGGAALGASEAQSSTISADLTEEYTLKRELERHDGLSALELRRDEKSGIMRYMPREQTVDMPTMGELGTETIGQTDEGRPMIANPDGTFSTERSITVEVDGKWYNIPSMYGGKEVSHDEAKRIAIENGMTDPETGRAFDPYASVDEAVAAAEARSSSIRGADGLTDNERANMAEYGDLFDPANPQSEMRAYDPSARENARAFISDTLTETFGVDPLKARDFSEFLMGNETAMGDMGIGVADLLGVGELMGIEEGLRQFDRGYQSGDIADMAIGPAIALLNAAGLRAPVQALLKSEPVQSMLQEGAERWAQGKSPVPMGMSVEPTDGSFLLDGGFDVDINDAGDLLTTSEMAGGPSKVLPTMEDVLQARSEQMALKPKDRVQPSGETIFDTTPDGYNRLEMPQAEVPVPRAPEGKLLPKGNRAAPVVDMSQKIADTLAERMRPHLGTAAQYFYHTGPLVEKAVEMGIPEDVARKQLKEFALNYAATSPRTQTEQNLRNASLTRSKEKAGIPLDKQVGPGGDGINEKGYPMMIGESGIHRKLVDAIRGNEGIDVNTNPKPYTFAENVAGNLDGVTVDTHAIRGALDAMNEVEPGSIPDGFILPKYREAYKADPSQLDPATYIDDTLGDQKVDGTKMQTEYAVFSDIYRLAAAKLGVSPAEAQSLGWFGSGHRTGLASEMKTVVELIDDRIDVTSQIMNVDKETVFKGFMEGSIPLLSFGGAVLLGAGSEEDK